MSLRDTLTSVLARDSRYTIQAYAFVFESLEHTKRLRRTDRSKVKAQKLRGSQPLGHVTGRELCAGVRDLALKQYGLLTILVLEQWGIRSTSDVGEIVYNLIDSGDFEKTPSDSRSDFDHVFEFEEEFGRNYVMTLDDVA